MTLEALEMKISQLREQPLVLLCRDPSGKEREMTLMECTRTGSTYIHVICDGLDKLLEDELPKIERGIAAERKEAIL